MTDNDPFLRSPYPRQSYGTTGSANVFVGYLAEGGDKGQPLRTYFFKSESSAKLYQTIQWENGALSCDCFGWIKRVSGGVRTCKHCRVVLAGLGINQAVRVIDHEVPGSLKLVIPSKKGDGDEDAQKNGRAFKFDQ